MRMRFAFRSGEEPRERPIMMSASVGGVGNGNANVVREVACILYKLVPNADKEGGR